MNYQDFKEYMPEIRQILVERVNNAETPADLFDVFTILPHVLEQAKVLRARDMALSA